MLALEITTGAGTLPLQYANRKTPLLADAPEWLEFPVYAGETINFQLAVDGAIRRFAVDFVEEGSDS